MRGVMTPALSLRNLRKVYNEKFEALKGISLEVMPGDFFAVLGPNGAGKSTTIGIISSLVRKTSGMVEVLVKISIPIFQWPRNFWVLYRKNSISVCLKKWKT
jgi:ABC-type multidrug transport system ATPase subunit